MTIARPPQHKVDDPIELIIHCDSAWQWEKIEAERVAEIALAKKEKRKPVEHPVIRYHSGETRFSLSAPMTDAKGNVCLVTDYLEGEYTVFQIRRLDWQEERKAKSLLNRDLGRGGGGEPAWEYCCRLALIGVDDGPELTSMGRKGGLSDEDMAELASYEGDLIDVIGRTALLASQPLTPAEKKL